MSGRARKNRLILAELARLYPGAGPELHFSNPYETLVATILSAQCTDKQVNKVTPRVFEDFPTVASMAAASAEVLYPYVRSCGFASKAANIVAACRKVMSDYGGSIPQTLGELTTLPGVGRKTANVVLANAFRVPTIAVDTHVFRVSNRLGLAEAATVEKTEQQLMQAIPRDSWIDAHHWLILHGRRVCRAQRPLCGACTLREYCDYYQREPRDADR